MKKQILIIAALLSVAVTTFAQITLPEQPKRAKHIDYSLRESGYWIAVQLSPAFATTGKEQALALQCDIIDGYRFSEFLKVGIGISPRLYTNTSPSFCGKNGRPFSLPIYADVRGNFTPQADAMFAICWSADIGYAINEGFYASPFIGIRTGGIRHNFIAGLSYSFQSHSVNDSNNPIHLVGLRIGYEF